MRERLVKAAKVIIVVASLLLVVYLFVEENDRRDVRPHCPTEDSCKPDYRDGHWYINGIPVTK